MIFRGKDSNIWNDDDCTAVKEQDSSNTHSSCDENMLFERINASGVGLTVDSIDSSKAHSCVSNITFRNCTMYNTFKEIISCFMLNQVKQIMFCFNTQKLESCRLSIDIVIVNIRICRIRVYMGIWEVVKYSVIPFILHIAYCHIVKPLPSLVMNM